MRTTPTARDPLRCSALMLHALPEEDRRWMLAALSRADAERLLPLLRELESLGIPRDASLVPNPGERPNEAGHWPQALDTGERDALLRVLAREPHGVARQLLSLRAWSWTPVLAAGMAAPDGERAMPVCVRPHCARFEATLLDILKKHVDAQADRAPARPATSAWPRARMLLARRRSTP